MPLPRSPILSVAVLGLGVWLSSAAPLAAEEAATAIAAPAVRWGEVAACRIVLPTFEPDAGSRPHTQSTRYPGGARLSQPVAAPCPAKFTSVDV